MAAKGKSIKYGPCTDWGKSSMLVHGRRHHKLEEVTGWKNLGRFEGVEERKQLQEFLASQSLRAKDATITSSKGQHIHGTLPIKKLMRLHQKWNWLRLTGKRKWKEW